VELPGLPGTVARGAQERVATFFASDGTDISRPGPARFFETPVSRSLPEDLNFMTGPPNALLRSDYVTVTPGGRAAGTAALPAAFTGGRGAARALPVPRRNAPADGTAGA